MRSASEACSKRHKYGTERLLSERSLSEAGGGVRPFIPIQARKAKKQTCKKQERNKKETRKKQERNKKETRKKEGGTPADA
jgi:hypothetical protein